MTRDWNADWERISRQMEEAFEARQTAYGELLAVFARSGTPTEEQLAAARVADQQFDAAKAASDRFIETWQES